MLYVASKRMKRLHYSKIKRKNELQKIFRHIRFCYIKNRTFEMVFGIKLYFTSNWLFTFGCFIPFQLRWTNQLMPQNHQIVFLNEWMNGKREARNKKMDSSTEYHWIIDMICEFSVFFVSFFSHFYSIIITVNHVVRAEQLWYMEEKKWYSMILFNYVIVLNFCLGKHKPKCEWHFHTMAKWNEEKAV